MASEAVVAAGLVVPGDVSGHHVAHAFQVPVHGAAQRMVLVAGPQHSGQTGVLVVGVPELFQQDVHGTLHGQAVVVHQRQQQVHTVAGDHFLAQREQVIDQYHVCPRDAPHAGQVGVLCHHAGQVDAQAMFDGHHDRLPAGGYAAQRETDIGVGGVSGGTYGVLHGQRLGPAPLGARVPVPDPRGHRTGQVRPDVFVGGGVGARIETCAVEHPHELPVSTPFMDSHVIEGEQQCVQPADAADPVGCGGGVAPARPARNLLPEERVPALLVREGHRCLQPGVVGVRHGFVSGVQPCLPRVRNRADADTCPQSQRHRIPCHAPPCRWASAVVETERCSVGNRGGRRSPRRVVGRRGSPSRPRAVMDPRVRKRSRARAVAASSPLVARVPVRRLT
ncbi:hypothetical protein QFZ76_009392 [Streptomyces sp. V4I2]|nr:hypothetical protein [Streptomyces sp. V4I2]